MKSIICLMFFAAGITTSDWLTDFATAKKEAISENKYILLNFSGSDWCAPCIKMKDEVFESEIFESLADKELILVNADFPRTKKHKLSSEQTVKNDSLAEQYNPMGKFPYTLLLDKEGKVVREWDGYVYDTQKKFILELKNELAKK